MDHIAMTVAVSMWLSAGFWALSGKMSTAADTALLAVGGTFYVLGEWAVREWRKRRTP